MPSWRLWTRVESPAPLLPLPIESFARTWCVPPGVAPFDERRLELLPGRGSPYEEWPNVSAHALGNAVPSETPAQTWRVRQQRLVADANTRRRKAAGQDRQSLRALLEDLIFDVFKGQEAVLVDTRALEEAALDPSTVVKAGVSGDHALIPADKNRILACLHSAAGSWPGRARPSGRSGSAGRSG